MLVLQVSFFRLNYYLFHIINLIKGVGLLVSSYGIGLLLLTPVFGVISDNPKIGRRYLVYFVIFIRLIFLLFIEELLWCWDCWGWLLVLYSLCLPILFIG